MTYEKSLIDLSDKGRKEGKKLRYEVGVFWAQNQDEPEIVAKFRCYGDAFAFATKLQVAPVYKYQVVIRS
jgi:hypothetical protein